MTVARGGNRSTKVLPLVALVLAFLIASVLPTALRPPPDQANASGAINPDAPPENNTQFVEATQEASGGGAGSSGETTTSTTSAPAAVKRTPSMGYCYGTPPRQIPSVYAGACVGAWKGDNGGRTYKNVFPNEIRISVEGTSAPPHGRLAPASSNTAATSADTRTWQTLEEYFNRHFQFYGRRMKFYGLDAPGDASASAAEASATIAAEQHQAFLMNNWIVGVCKPFARKGFVAFCAPASQAENAELAPGVYSSFMDLDQGVGFGAEFACKTLVGKPARFGGGDVNGRPRKFGYLGYRGTKGGIDAQRFAQAFKRECNGEVDVVTLANDNDAQGAIAAVSRFRANSCLWATQSSSQPVPPSLLRHNSATYLQNRHEVLSFQLHSQGRARTFTGVLGGSTVAW